MHIKELGELAIHDDIPEWLVSREIEVSYFPGSKLRFVLEDLMEDARPEEFASAVARFLALTCRDREGAASYVFKNYSDFRDAVGEEDIGVSIAGPAEVWDHVQPQQIYVKRRPYGDRKVYVTIASECDWEPEHGLQIVYREGGELKRVSAQDGHLTHVDAYDLPEDQDRIA